MSFSFREPEEEPACECRYDETHDEMDRDDCAFHSSLCDEIPEVELQPAKRKPAGVEGHASPRREARETAALDATQAAQR
jgi:hypothetical protein